MGLAGENRTSARSGHYTDVTRLRTVTLVDIRLALLAVLANVAVVVLVGTGFPLVALGLAVIPAVLALAVPWHRIPRVDARLVAVVVAGNVVVFGLLVAGLGLLLLFLVLAVPAALAIADRPQRGVLALAGLAPFDGVLEILPLPALADYWTEALAVVVLAGTFVAPASARGRPDRPLPTWRIGVYGFVGIAVLSALTVAPVQAAVGLKISFFYIVALVAVWRCPLDERERDRFVSILMAVGLLAALIGLGQQLVGPAALAALGYEYNSTIRFAGSFMRSFSTFVQPFGFGFFLMVVLLIGIPVALDDVRRLRHRFFLALLPVYGLALLSTIVRGAWLGVLLGGVYLGAHRYRILLLGLPLALLVLVAVPPEAVGTALSSSSSVERAEGWQANVERVGDHPLGEGIGSTGSAALSVVRLGGDANTYQTDNYYFKVVLELGILGLWAFLLALAGIFGQQRRASKLLRGPDAALAAGAGAATIAAAGACFVASYFDIFPMDFLFWVLAGIVADLTARADLDRRAGEASA